MSHHYGEDAVRSRMTPTHFEIEIRNHETNAVISVRGPIEGVFETRNRKMSHSEAGNLGRAIAHLLRDYLK